MQTSDFDFQLPEELIAQSPTEARDHCRLMLLDKNNQKIQHKHFYDLIDILDENYVLVFNNSKVIPARLFAVPINSPINKGRCPQDRGVEILLIKQINKNSWTCMVKPGKKFQIGSEFQILSKDQENLSDFSCKVEKINEDGTRILEFKSPLDKRGWEDLFQQGHMPLPPYIKIDQKNEEKFENLYQTVYADQNNAKSIAAPTAGLHFTDELLEKLKNKGVKTEFVTLHVGLGTFLPVKTENLDEHKMHSEYYILDKDSSERLNNYKKLGKKIIAVGTTSIRVLESCSKEKNQINAQSGDTDIFIKPGYEFKFVDGLITNFHLPKSTLIMLISAFAGKDFVFKAYEEAIKEKYRFYSFGDAMMIL